MQNERLIEYIRKHNSELKPVPTGVEPVLRDPGAVKAVVFDVYGTMFISASGDISLADLTDSRKAARHAWDDAGIDPGFTDVDSMPAFFRSEIKKRHGELKEQDVEYPEIDVVEIWSAVFAEYCKALPEKDIIELFSLAYESNVNPVWPMPGLAELLEYLEGTGLVRGIVSNAQFYTPLLFPALSGKTLDEWNFNPSCCQWSYRVRRGKPDSKMFLNLLRELNEWYTIKASEVLYIGNDMLNDIWTASSCGMKTALFAGDKRSLRMRENDSRCRGLEPDLVLTELIQLREIIG